MQSAVPTAALDDRVLLDLIARKRDADAFDLFCRRHESAAFNLALHITRDREAAEEAVQEALLRVWKSASAFRADGAPRAWLLRIVARQSLKAYHARVRAQKSAELEKFRPPKEDGAPPAESLEQNEILAALRRLVGELSAQDGQLVALYFGGGMSHEEIAKVLSMPRPTVSYKLGKALENMRGALARAGFAAAPALASESLGAALCGGETVSTALHQQFIGQIGSAVARSARYARPAVPAKSGLSAGAGAVALLAVVGGVAWFAFARKPLPPSSAAAQASEQPVEATAQAAVLPQKKNDDGWRAVPTQPQILRHGDIQMDRRNMLPTGQYNFQFHDDGLGIWRVSELPGGTELLQSKDNLGQHDQIMLGPLVSGVGEWTGMLDTAEGPGHEFGFTIMSAQQQSRIFGRFNADGGPGSIRVVAWPLANGIRVVSIRTRATGERRVGSEFLVSSDGKYNIGFLTNCKTALRGLRFRPLPADWTPERDPQLRGHTVPRKLRE